MIRSVSLDLYILRHWANFVDNFKDSLMAVGIMEQRERYDVKLIDAFARASYQELDYNAEGRNQVRFIKELSPKMSHDIYVPPVFWSATNRKVLTTEWVEGKQLAKSSPEVIQRLTPIGVKCFLMQLLDTGFFHSDPHPGNLLVNERGQLVLIDFGLCAEVSQPDTKALTQTIVHVMDGNVPGVLESCIGLGFLPDDVDRDRLIPVLQTIFDEAQIARERHEKQGGDDVQVYHTAARRKQFKAVSRQLNQVFFDFPFEVPEYFALITRALIVLEGIAVSGDSKFDIFAASYPYASLRAVQLFGIADVAKILGAVATAGIS